MDVRIFSRTSSYAILLGISVVTSLSACSSSEEPTPGEAPAKLVEVPSRSEEELLVAAQQAYDKGLFSVAEKTWVELRDGYPASPMAIFAELKVADSIFFRGDFPNALAAYETFLREHPAHEAVPYVRYQIARSHLGQYQGKTRDQSPLQNALKIFEQVVTEFPGNEYSILARREIARCRGLLAEYEAFVADFYEKRGADVASKKRRAMLVTMYPESPQSLAVTSSTAGDEAPTTWKIPEKLKGALSPTVPEVVAVNPDLNQAGLVKFNQLTASQLDAPPSLPINEASISAKVGEDSHNIERTVGELFSAANCERGESATILTLQTLTKVEVRSVDSEGRGIYRALLDLDSASRFSTGNISTLAVDGCPIALSSISQRRDGKGVELLIQAPTKPVVMSLQRPTRLALIAQ